MRVFAVMFASVVFFFLVSLYFLWEDWKIRRKEKIVKKLAGDEDSRISHLHGKGMGRGGGFGKGLVEKAAHLAVIEPLLNSLNLNMSLERFIVLSLGFGITLCIPTFILSGSLVFSSLLFCVGALVPALYALYMKKRREQTLVKQLPDAIDMIVRSLRVGQSVDGALKDVGTGMPDPIGAEIKNVYDEIAIGLPFEVAVRNFENRYRNSTDVKILCSAFIIQRESGGNLTEILDELSHTIRERFALKMQVKAASSESRTSAIVLSLVPVGFGLITWLLNPGYISRLLNDPLGRKILFFAIFLNLFAYLVMRRLTKIEV